MFSVGSEYSRICSNFLDGLKDLIWAAVPCACAALLVYARGGFDMDEQVFSPDELCGPYRIVKLLGCGGFAEVYLAVDDALNSHVAIKCLRLCHVKNARNIKRLAAETEILCELDHPNIVQVEDAGVSKGVLWLAMEYLSGQTLRQLIRRARGPLPAGLALYYASRIADGVGAAHALNVVHRDLKPENVMVTQRDEVKVLDLGSAKFFDRDLTLSSGSSVLGTPLYMSPEQIKGEVVDARTDVYALGLILYELLAGRHALTVLSGKLPPAFEVGTLQLHARPKALHEVVRGLPEFLWPLVSKAIEKDPGERFETMAEFAQAMREASKQLSDVPGAEKLWELGRDAEEIEGEEEFDKDWAKTPADEHQATARADVKELSVWKHAANDGGDEEGALGAKNEGGAVERQAGAKPPWMCEEQLEGMHLEAGPHQSCVRSVSVLRPSPASKVHTAPVIQLWSRRERKLAKEKALAAKAADTSAADISPMAASVEMRPIAMEGAGGAALSGGASTLEMSKTVFDVPQALAPTQKIELGDASAMDAIQANAGDMAASPQSVNELVPQSSKARRKASSAQRFVLIAGALLSAALLVWSMSPGRQLPAQTAMSAAPPLENAPTPPVVRVNTDTAVKPESPDMAAASVAEPAEAGNGVHAVTASRENESALRARSNGPASSKRARIPGDSAAGNAPNRCATGLFASAELGVCFQDLDKQASAQSSK